MRQDYRLITRNLIAKALNIPRVSAEMLLNNIPPEAIFDISQADPAEADRLIKKAFEPKQETEPEPPEVEETEETTDTVDVSGLDT